MHNDIEFSDSPVTQGLAFNDLGKITSYVLSFENLNVEITLLEGGVVRIAHGLSGVALPLPVLEAISRLDLAGMAITELKEEEDD